MRPRWRLLVEFQWQTDAVLDVDLKDQPALTPHTRLIGVREEVVWWNRHRKVDQFSSVEVDAVAQQKCLQSP